MAVKPKKRIKPRISVTLDPDVYDRVRGVSRRVPGLSVSGVVNELLAIGLPVMEELARTFIELRNDDGSIDEERARDRLAQWAGAQLLGLSDTFGPGAGEERLKTSA